MQFGPNTPGYYDNLAPPYIIGLVITTAIAIIALAFRIYAQWLIRNLKAWDNIFAILAFTSLVPLNFFTGWQFTKGAGQHYYRVLYDDPDSPMNMRSIFIAWYWTSIASAQACLWIKLAMLMFIKRVLPCDTLFFRTSWWIVMVLTIMIGIGATIEFTFVCWPISFFWDRVLVAYAVGYPGAQDMAGGWCMPLPTYLEVPLIASFITDVFLFFLPLIPLWKMRLPLFKKFSVFLTLSLGLFAIGIDVVRIWEIVHFDVLGDVTWLNTPGVTWNAIEYNVALVSACIPAMAPLLRKELWKRGAAARGRKQAFWQLGGDPYQDPSNKSERNLLNTAAAPGYNKADFRVWGDRSEDWRHQKRRGSDDDNTSLWSGDTRSDSRAQTERERLRRESSTGFYGRRTSDSTVITNEFHPMAPLKQTRTNTPPPQHISEWV